MARAASAAQAPSGGSVPWLLGVCCGAALAFATSAAILCGVLLAPALLTAAIDKLPGKPSARIVALTGSGFVIGPLWRLYTTGAASMEAATTLLTDPAVLCPAWIAGVVGWGLSELLPALVRAATERLTDLRIAALEREAEELRAAWIFDQGP